MPPGAEDVTTAFAPLARKAETIDAQITKAEAELEGLHTERIGLASALSWADPVGHTAQPARVQVEARLKAEREEAERNRLARRQGEQQAELARQAKAEDEARRQREESEAVAARQTALH